MQITAMHNEGWKEEEVATQNTRIKMQNTVLAVNSLSARVLFHDMNGKEHKMDIWVGSMVYTYSMSKYNKKRNGFLLL